MTATQSDLVAPAPAPGSVSASALASAPTPAPAPVSRRRFSRRGFIRLGLVGLPAIATTAAGTTGWLWRSAKIDQAGHTTFTNPLAVPPLCPSRVDDQGRRVFDLRMAAGSKVFRAGGGRTRTWGLNGDYLGPTIRAARGETVLINVHNGLDEATTLHWHGMHLPARMDGGPHQLVQPGETWSPTWALDQPAATGWYHPHPHGQTAQHVYRGLAGVFIVDDPATTGVGLPSRYGVDDVPVIVQDKRFTDHDQFDPSPPAMSGIGFLGDTILANGTTAAYHDVSTERIRLRLLNASNARVFNLGLSDDRLVLLVGTDAGLLDSPQPIRRIQLSPGERAEIVVAMRPGERVSLRGFQPDLGTSAWNARFSGGHDDFDILQLRAAGTLTATPEPPATLVPATAAPADGPVVRHFTLSGVEINGRRMDPGRIDFAVRRDTAEVWEVVNIDDLPHNFHVHDVRFRVISVAGKPPPAALRGWKDTVYLPPRQPIRLAVRIGRHADPNTPYMYHCHLLTHEDAGMMGQFVVLEPGQSAGRPQHSAHHGH